MKTEKNKRKRIKTSAVFGNALQHVPYGKSPAHSLEEQTDETVSAQNWYHFSNGKRNIGPSNLKRTAKLPGSLDTHDIGPDKVPLWTAIWSTDKIELWDVIKSTSEEVQIHKAITALNSGKRCGINFSELEIDAADLYIRALIEYTDEILNFIDLIDNHPDPFLHKQINNRKSYKMVDLYDLVAVIAAYRFCDLFYFPRNPQHLAPLSDCVKKLINNHGIKNTLIKYRIYDEISQELSLEDNSITSTPTINYEDIANTIVYSIETHNGQPTYHLSNNTKKMGLGYFIYDKINNKQPRLDCIENKIDLTKVSADLYSYLISLPADQELDKFVNEFFTDLEEADET